MNGPVRSVCERLQRDGWVVVSDPNVNEFDVVALRDGDPPRLVKVSGRSTDPFTSIGAAHLAHLSSLAASAGAQAFVAYWPPAGPTLVPEADWPRDEVSS